MGGTDAAPLDLASTELGHGRPVVVLHGLLGRGRNWLSTARALQDRYAFHLVDLRNHGASPWSEEMSYQAMAGDLAALVEGLGAGAARLVGHSMGGKAAMVLALTRPDLVERLIVVDIAPVPYPQGYEGYVRAMQGVDLGAVARRADADAALAPAVPDADVRGFLLQNLGGAEGRRLAWQPNLAVLLRTMPALTGFPAELAGRVYAGPAWCLRGARSDYVTPAGEAALRRHFPSLQVSTVPGAGHWPHAERPAAFLDLLAPALAAS